MSTVTITEFLLARIAEDREQATRSKADVAAGKQFAVFASWINLTADRMLAECEAKRRIVELHQSWPVLVESEPVFESADPADPNSMTYRMSKQIAWATEQEYRAKFGVEPPTAPMLRTLASVYADHPDFQEGWR